MFYCNLKKYIYIYLFPFNLYSVSIRFANMTFKKYIYIVSLILLIIIIVIQNVCNFFFFCEIKIRVIVNVLYFMLYTRHAILSVSDIRKEMAEISNSQRWRGIKLNIICHVIHYVHCIHSCSVLKLPCLNKWGFADTKKELNFGQCSFPHYLVHQTFVILIVMH